jgi:hypothetical protein
MLEINTDIRNSCCFGQGTFWAFPFNVLGIFQSIPSLAAEEKRERAFAAVDIITGVGAIGYNIANAIYLISLIKPLKDAFHAAGSILSLVGTVLSTISAIGYVLIYRQVSSVLDKLKPDLSTFKDPNITSSDIARLFNVSNGARLKERILKISESNNEEAINKLNKAVVIRLTERKSLLTLAIGNALLSILVSIAFFVLFTSPLAPVAVGLSAIVLGIQLYQTYRNYTSSKKFRKALAEVEASLDL